MRRDEDVDRNRDAWDDVINRPEGPHYIDAEIDNGGGIRLTARCEAETDAPCYAHCESGCEYFPCDHPPAVGRICNVIEFLNAEDPTELFDGASGTPFTPGPITTHWIGETYVWRFAARLDAGSGEPQ